MHTFSNTGFTSLTRKAVPTKENYIEEVIRPSQVPAAPECARRQRPVRRSEDHPI